LRRDQDGLVAGAEALVFGVLVFVVGTLIAVNAWVVVDSEMAANAAAREAARTVAETRAPTWAVAIEQARTVAGDTLAAYGHHPGTAEVTVGGGPDGSGLADLSVAPMRCQRITVRVTYPVPRLTIPLVGGWIGTRDATGVHSDVVDPLRSGLDGSADCV
jgi:hypothetical protein